MGACALDAVALLGAFLAGRAGSVTGLGMAVFVTGLANAVFSLARQAYLTEAVPIHARARAMSTLGGVFRLGSFIGPFAGALVVSRFSIGAAYAFAAAMSLLPPYSSRSCPDVGRTPHADRAPGPATPQPSVLSVLRAHRRVLLTLGLGVLVISAVRASRQVIIPLWGEATGISPAATSLIFGISAGVDLLLFYPGGAVMDRFGRVWVAVPSMIIMGLGLLLLPLTTTALGITPSPAYWASATESRPGSCSPWARTPRPRSAVAVSRRLAAVRRPRQHPGSVDHQRDRRARVAGGGLRRPRRPGRSRCRLVGPAGASLCPPG